jgi:hypothetical protein
LVQVKEASSVQAFACSKVNFSGPVWEQCWLKKYWY